MSATNTFETIVRLNTAEAKNNLADLKKKVDDLTAARDKAIAAKSDTNFVKQLSKDLNKARAELKAYETNVDKTIETIINLQKSSLGDVESAMRALKKEMKSTSDPKEYQELEAKLALCRERMEELKTAAATTARQFKEIAGGGSLVKSVLDDIDNASADALTAAQQAIEQRMGGMSPSSDAYKEQNTDLLRIKARLQEIAQGQKVVNTIVDQYNAGLKEADDQARKVANSQDLIDRTMDKLSFAPIRDLEYSMKMLNEQMENMDRSSDEFKEAEEKMRQLRTEIKKVGEEAKVSQGAFGSLADFLNRNWGAISQIYFSGKRMFEWVRKATDEFTKMEDVLANVRKYTGQTDEEVRQMQESLKQMDTRTSREQLNELAGAAGRLGISATEEIVKFVDAADKIGVALGDDLGDGAVDQIGKLAMAFGEDEKMGLNKAMYATGSAINELSANSSANAGYLVDFAARLSGVGKQAGLTQAQIMGLGAVMDENMQRDEMASTALSQIITSMITDTETFARMAGQNLQDFSNLVRTDMNQALLTFFTAMKAKGGFADIAPLFDEMGLSGARATQVLTVFADKVDDVRENQQLATEAYREGTSVIKEYNIQNDTEQAKIDKAKKSLQELTIELGQKLLPVSRACISTGSLAIKTLAMVTDFLLKHWDALLVVTAAIIAYNAATLKKIVLDKLQAFWNNVLVASFKKLWAVVTANPYIAIAAAVTIVIMKLAQLTKANDKVARSQKVINDARKEAARLAAEESTKVDILRRKIHDSNIPLAKRLEYIEELKKIVPGYNVMVSNEGEAYNENTRALENYNKELKKNSLIKAGEKKMEEKAADLADVQLAIAAAEERIQYIKDNPDASEFQAPAENGVTMSTASLALTMAEDYLADLRAKEAEIKAEQDKIYKTIISPNLPSGTVAKNSVDPNPPVPDPDPTDPFDTRSAQLKAEYDKELVVLKQSLVDKELTEDEYNAKSLAARENYLRNLLDLQVSYGKDTTSTQDDILDMVLQSAADREAREKQAKEQQLKDALATLDDSTNAEKIAAAQARADGELSEQEYRDRLNDILYWYYVDRKGIIDEFEGDSSGETLKLAEMRIEGRDADNAAKLATLEDEYNSAGSAAGQLSAAQAMYDAGLITFEQFEQKKTEIAEREAEKRKAVEQLAFNTFMQLTSGMADYYSACSDAEQAAVEHRYDAEIAKAGENTAKGKKLEEQKQKEIAAVKTRYNKKAQKIQIAQALASTAMSAINAYSSAAQVPLIGYILAPIAAAAAIAAGMLQVAAIKKQAQAQEAGYYDGGFTGGSNYRREAGVVHEGEFVANHQALANPAIMPALQLIDYAQRHNTVGSLTAADISRSVGGAATVVSAPVVNVQTDNDALNASLAGLNDAVGVLVGTLQAGIRSTVAIDGPDGVYHQMKHFERLRNNTDL